MWFYDFCSFYIVCLKMVSQRSRRPLKKNGTRGFILPKYEPNPSHGDPFHPQNHWFWHAFLWNLPSELWELMCFLWIHHSEMWKLMCFCGFTHSETWKLMRVCGFRKRGNLWVFVDSPLGNVDTYAFLWIHPWETWKRMRFREFTLRKSRKSSSPGKV